MFLGASVSSATETQMSSRPQALSASSMSCSVACSSVVWRGYGIHFVLGEMVSVMVETRVVAVGESSSDGGQQA